MSATSNASDLAMAVGRAMMQKEYNRCECRFYLSERCQELGAQLAQVEEENKGELWEEKDYLHVIDLLCERVIGDLPCDVSELVDLSNATKVGDLPLGLKPMSVATGEARRALNVKAGES